MLFSKIVRLFQRKRSSLPAELAALRSVDQMRGLLDRERARADRSGVGFAVLKFVPREPAAAQETLSVLATILKRRLRSTDETGWMGEHQLAAVLPCTAAAGARRVAHEVCAGFGELAAPHCEVFCYPTNSGNDGDDRQNGAPGHAETPTSALEPVFVQPMSLAKRTLDVFGAVLALALFAPFMLVAGVAVKVTSPGPVFFKQLRAGRGNKPFSMYKFRTMRVGADRLKQQLLEHNELDGPAFKIKNDPRLTPIGRFLRRASIDELPQLWNVLKGDMSLVGPRPLPCDESAACSAWQKERLNVKPGLTCIWQVTGRSTVNFDDWMRMDLNYVQNGSFAKDLKILAATVPAVMFGEGAY